MCNDLYSCIVPGPPENFNVTAINYTTVFLSWDRPILENGIILFYTISYNGSREEKQTVRTHVKF